MQNPYSFASQRPRNLRRCSFNELAAFLNYLRIEAGMDAKPYAGTSKESVIRRITDLELASNRES